ncbi:MAG: cation-translocating P-type ATPase [Parachlamydiaceae bacterium]|nr:cation-translocating P-type ATPase [Parachlamydiaceae bacterium]
MNQKNLEDTLQACVLCATPIKRGGYVDGTNAFCCAGCHAVYQILFCQEALVNFKEHPLFQQALKSGLISNPDLIEQISKSTLEDYQDEDTKRIYFEVEEMWCPSCAQVIYLILMQQKGIRSCTVDYSTDLASIQFSQRIITKEKIFQLISRLGYTPKDLQDDEKKVVSSSLYLRFIIAAFCSANIMMFAYPIYASYFEAETTGYTQLFTLLSAVGSLPVITYCSWPIWRRFFTGLRVGVWGMETLVLIGMVAAFCLSLYEMLNESSIVYFDSMTVIVVFVLLGKIIESKAKFSAKDSLIRLTRGLPRRGRKLFGNGNEQFVPLKEIAIGDRIIALTGEKIVLDGVVEKGEGACDESLMTGESLPVLKKNGSLVLAGSIVMQGRLVLKVTSLTEETALHRIISMVEQDIGHKSQYVRAVDPIVRWFVPIVFGLALITSLFCLMMEIADPGYTFIQTAIIRAISVLLISCPCAIGIAAPLAESHVLNALSKIGAIVRNRGCLAALGKETIYAFDKTGTITEGNFKVLDGLTEIEFISKTYLKALVACSNHPISVAINRALLCYTGQIEKSEEIIGKGLRGMVGDDQYYIGSLRFLKEQNVVIPETCEKEPSIIGTVVYFGKNKEYLAKIVLGDILRKDAKKTIDSLVDAKTLLLSGDANRTVQLVAEQCGFKDWYGECHPLQKRKLIYELRQSGEVVAMLGDGINDAPALTAANIGIAVLTATDASIQVSDILLTTDRLMIIPEMRQIAMKGHRIVKQNLFWAFIYNIIGIGLAMTGFLSPIFAAFAMVASSLIVLFNAQRIRQKI